MGYTIIQSVKNSRAALKEPKNKNEITVDARALQQAVELEKSNALYRSLLERTSDLITSLDGMGNILFANRTWLSKMEYTLDEVMLTSIFKYIHPAYIDHCTTFFGSLQHTENEIPIAYSLISKSGKEVQLDGRISVTFKNDQLYKVDTHFTDVTEINRLKKADENSKRLLKLFKDAVDVSAIVSVTDHKGIITYVNENFSNISGYTSDELLNRTHAIVNSAYHDKQFFKDLWKTISSGKTWKGIIKNKAKNGNTYWVDSTIVPIPAEDNNYEYVSIRHDITKEYEAETRLREQKNFYENILNNIPGNVAVFDINGKYVFINPQTVKDAKLRQWLIGKDNYDYCNYRGISTELADEREKHFQLLRENGSFHRNIEQKKLANGTFQYMDSLMSIYEYEGQKFIIAYAVDITTVKQAQVEIQRLKLFYENILHNIPVDIAVFDKNHKYTFLNKEAIKDDALRAWMVGKDDFDYADLKGLPATFAQHRRDAFNQVINSGEDLVWLDKQIAKTGEVKYKQRSMHAFADAQIVVGYAVDITTLHTTQLELYQSKNDLIATNKNLELEIGKRIKELKESNASLESFAYSISHDLKAPVRQIGSFTGLLKKALLKDDKLQANEHFNYIEQAVTVLSERINGLLQFSKYGTDGISVSEFALAEEFNKAFALYSNNYRQLHYTFVNNITSSVRADKTLIGAVVENLVSNAIKYSIPKKEIYVELGEMEKEGETVYYVRDNGIGFDMKYYDKIFALFQRLHQDSEVEGTGIGLAHVKRIIERHNGRIWAESELGKGTTFYFTLNLGK